MTLATDLRAIAQSVRDQRGDYLAALDALADRLEALTVYVAVPEPPDAEPAVFATEQAADAFAATYTDEAPVYGLLVCDGDLAATMVAERIDDDHED